MRWSDATARPTDRKLREFAAASAALCLALAIWRFTSGNTWIVGAWLLIAATAIGVACWRPRWLAPLFTAAMIVTFPLAWAVSLALLALVFYLVITPLALVFRVTGRDALTRRPQPDQASYWQAQPPAEQPQRYLQQY
jgi:hypothetical protein